MAWDGIDRRKQSVAFDGPDRRAAAFWKVPKRVTSLRDEQVRELASQRRLERLDAWKAGEYQE